MTSNRETPDHIELTKNEHSLHTALFNIESSRWDENIDFRKFIAELDQDRVFQHYPAYIIFKQTNILLLGVQGAFLDTVSDEIKSKFDNLGIGLDYVNTTYDDNILSDDIKRNIVQRCILMLFLYRAALDGLYTPDTTGISGIIIGVIDSLIPKNTSL